MSSRRLSFVKIVALLIGVSGCRGHSQTVSDQDQLKTNALERSVVWLDGDGVVEAKLSGDPQGDEHWQRLRQGERQRWVRAVRVGGGDVMIQLDEVGPLGPTTLWLRTGTVALLGQDSEGAIYLELEHGAARLKSMATDPQTDPVASQQAFVVTDRGRVRVSGRDVMIDKTPGMAQVIAFTSETPQRADWTHAIGNAGLDDGFGQLTASVSGSEPSALRLDAVAVRVKTSAGWAYTSVEHTFHNDSDELLEGTFRFPVPAHAMVESLAMEIGGRLIEGEIVEKEKAAEVYENIVDNMLDPALLEWEQGNWFKLRVFPIEANADKRVIIRYSSPLAPTLAGYEYRFSATAADMQKSIKRFTLEVDGAAVKTIDDLNTTEDVVVAVGRTDVPVVSQQVDGDHRYVAIRVRPDWTAVKAPAVASQERLLILFDTSRSALEGRDLALTTLESLLTELAPNTRFGLAQVDVKSAMLTDGFVAPSKSSITAAISSVSSIEMDGASDLGAAFSLARQLGATQVVYIGDGTPTWGITADVDLTTHAATTLAGTPVFGALIGKGSSSMLWKTMTARLGGRIEVTTTPLVAKRFAFFVARASSVKRIDNLTVEFVDGHGSAIGNAVVYPRVPQTLFSDDELVVVGRLDQQHATDVMLRVSGGAAGRRFEHQVALAGAVSAQKVSQQWAVHHIAARLSEGAEKDEIVELSRDYGILSRHTSLLVLESEEAYAEHKIERRRGPLALAAASRLVTGGDLESLSARQASLSPNQIQPGDPEIRVPAAKDAERVTVLFPFGETKLAVYDDEARAWIVRFLIDKDTPDGDYTVTVLVTHRDGRVEQSQLNYTVDTVAPEVKVSLSRRPDGSYWIVARQLRGHRQRRDLHRVEVAMPDGQIINLSQTAWGRFEREWKPLPRMAATMTDDGFSISITVTDRALNQSVTTLRIEGAEHDELGQ